MRSARFRGVLAGPHRVDAVLAAAFCAVSLVQVLLDPIASRPVSVLVAVGSTLPLAWRRRRPVAAALAGSAIWLIPTDGFLYLGYFVAVLLFFSVGAHVARLRVTIAVAAAGAVIAAVATLRGPEPPPAAFGSVLAVAAPAAVGRLVRHQREQAERLEDLTERLRRERAGAERAAEPTGSVIEHDASLPVSLPAAQPSPRALVRRPRAWSGSRRRARRPARGGARGPGRCPSRRS